jgi:hypothetical protein
LNQQVEADVNDPGVKEHGNDEPEPLIWLRAIVQGAARNRVRDSIETAQL